MTEDDYIKRAQGAFADLKAALYQIEQINMKAGRGEIANKVMGIKGRVLTLHSDAAQVLYDYYPAGTGDAVVIQGGGGR